MSLFNKQKLIIVLNTFFVVLATCVITVAQELKDLRVDGSDIRPNISRAPAGNKVPKVKLEKKKSRTYVSGLCTDSFGRSHYAPSEGYYGCLDHSNGGEHGIWGRQRYLNMGVIINP